MDVNVNIICTYNDTKTKNVPSLISAGCRSVHHSLDEISASCHISKRFHLVTVNSTCEIARIPARHLIRYRLKKNCDRSEVRHHK